MPCYTIQQSHVEFLAKSTDLTLFTEALRKLGFEVTELSGRLDLRKRDPNGYFRSGSYDCATGRLELDSTWDVNEIKRAYSERVVESQAQVRLAIGVEHQCHWSPPSHCAPEGVRPCRSTN